MFSFRVYPDGRVPGVGVGGGVECAELWQLDIKVSPKPPSPRSCQWAASLVGEMIPVISTCEFPPKQGEQGDSEQTASEAVKYSTVYEYLEYLNM